MNKAIYALSGDPIHYGHIDIIERASKAFDTLIVGIGVNPSKKYSFSLEERLDMAQRSLYNVPNKEVKPFKGLLVDYAAENGIKTIVKGIRGESDLDYELMLHHVGESQKLGIDTFFLPSNQKMTHISSSTVKALQAEQGLVHEYVPLNVKQKLEERISGQYVIGITGEIGVGKSFIGKKIESSLKNMGLEAYNIELDEIGHQILGTLKEDLYKNTREKIIRDFGPHISLPDSMIDRKQLGEIVFNDPEKMDRLNEIMYTPILVKLRREIYGKKGIILLNAALLAESDLSYLCNNNVILVSAAESIQKERLERRGLSKDQILRREESQYDAEEKRKTLKNKIEKNNHGIIWEIDNTNATDVSHIIESISKYFRLEAK